MSFESYLLFYSPYERLLMKYIIALLISMIPLVELRGAVPVYRLRYPLVASPNSLCHWEHDSSSIIFFFARRVLEWGQINL